MRSIGTIFLVFFALIATINALNCRPLACLVVCPNGFEIDAQGCPICTCRRSQATGTSTTGRTTPTRPVTTRTTPTRPVTTRTTPTRPPTTRTTPTRPPTTRSTTRRISTTRRW